MKNQYIAKWLGRFSLIIMLLFLAFLLSSFLRGVSKEPGFTLSQVSVPTPTDSYSLQTDGAEPTPLTRATSDPNQTPTPVPPLLPVPKEPTPTLDPMLWVLPTFDAVVVSTAESEPSEPLSTATPLPPLTADSPNLFSVQNIEFGPLVILREKLPEESTGVGFPTWSPDGTLFAFTQPTSVVKKGQYELATGTVVDMYWPESEIIIADASGQDKLSLGPGTELSWSLSSDFIAYINPSDNLEEYYIQIINIKTHQIFVVTTLKAGKEYSTLAWLSETELVYYQETLILFDYTTGEKKKLLDMATSEISVDTSSPLKYLTTGPKYGLIVAGSGLETLILERRGTEIHLVKQLEGLNFNASAISPDGNFFSYAAPPFGQVKIVSIYKDEPVIELPAPSRGPVESIAWAPDSASLVYLDSDGVHIVNRDGSGLQLIDGLSGGSGRVAWSPQGTSLLVAPLEGELLSLSISTKIKDTQEGGK